MTLPNDVTRALETIEAGVSLVSGNALAYRNAGRALACFVRAQQKRTCDTCEHSFMPAPQADNELGPHNELACRMTSNDQEICYTCCAALGNGCRAWQGEMAP